MAAFKLVRPKGGDKTKPKVMALEASHIVPVRRRDRDWPHAHRWWRIQERYAGVISALPLASDLGIVLMDAAQQWRWGVVKSAQLMAVKVHRRVLPARKE